MKTNEFKEIVHKVTQDKYIAYGYDEDGHIVSYILMFKQCIDDIKKNMK